MAKVGGISTAFEVDGKSRWGNFYSGINVRTFGGLSNEIAELLKATTTTIGVLKGFVQDGLERRPDGEIRLASITGLPFRSLLIPSQFPIDASLTLSAQQIDISLPTKYINNQPVSGPQLSDTLKSGGRDAGLPDEELEALIDLAEKTEALSELVGRTDSEFSSQAGLRVMVNGQPRALRFISDPDYAQAAPRSHRDHGEHSVMCIANKPEMHTAVGTDDDLIENPKGKVEVGDGEVEVFSGNWTDHSVPIVQQGTATERVAVLATFNLGR